MENRRLLLAAFLSAVIVIAWSYLFPPAPVAPPESPETPAAGETTSPDDPAPSPTEPTGGEAAADASTVDDAPAADTAPEDAPAAEAPVEPEPLEIVRAESEERIVIEDARMRVEMTNRGAQLLTYQLKGHRDEDGESLDLVRPRGSDLYPFALMEGDGGSRLNTALFQWQQGTDDEGRPWVSFRHASDAGVAEKHFRWGPRGFLEVELEVRDRAGEREGDWGFVLGPGLNDEPVGNSYSRGVHRAAGYLRGEEAELLEADDVEEDVFVDTRGLEWVSLEDNFFLVALVPASGVSEVWIRPVLERPQVEEGRPRFLPIDTASSDDDLVEELLLVARADGERMEVSTYFGAKRYSYLTELPHDLEESVRWGFLGFLSKPLYLILEWIHGNTVPNYGWAIVLVTLLIKLVFFPLTHKSQESMGKMQELNPKVQAIRAKYRSKLKDKQGRPNLDAQKQMNEEVMAVYKSAGVNPASGCLPILLQMPVFFAFYKLLTTVVELRGAPWVLWVRDLSQPDPIWVLPLVMGATSLAMQRMMPSSPDPMQRRLMQMMPIMFTVFAFTFPSGLVLYWLTNNVLTMGQQAIILRMKKARGEDPKKDPKKAPKT